MTSLISAATLVFLLSGGAAVDPQTPSPAPSGTGHAAAPAQQDAGAQPNDRAVNPSQPDFTLVGLPTTLRIPKFGSSFRVTHRFTRPLGVGDFGDLADDFFGLDGGAQIGLEYRFGLRSGTQIGFHRTNDRTIEFFAQHEVLRQNGRSPVSIEALAAFEGTNNLHDSEEDGIFASYSPSVGAVISRELGRHGAVYVEPIWVNNTNPLPSELIDDNDTFMIGLGARLRIRPTVYVVVEGVPRVGFDPGVAQLSFGLEKRAGGHTFQINFSNGIGTTFGQLARGGTDSDDWYLGFNISRKFFR
jgi:Membrane bound beta barrel domain (DUF5777)